MRVRVPPPAPRCARAVTPEGLSNRAAARSHAREDLSFRPEYRHIPMEERLLDGVVEAVDRLPPGGLGSLRYPLRKSSGD